MTIRQSTGRYPLVDFHSHILPALDDGSHSAEESLAMLSAAAEQGVMTMVATPHFYSEQENLDDFLKRRDAAVQRLLAGGYDPRIHPEVCVGAEVAYFTGIGRCDDIKRLCIQGTGTVLIELPTGTLGNDIIEDIRLMRQRLRLTPILAHIERYPALRERSLRRTLLDHGALLQISAVLAENWMARRWALRLLLHDEVQLLGSDCHNLTTRPPNMGVMAEFLARSGKEKLLSALAKIGMSVLNGAHPIMSCDAQ